MFVYELSSCGFESRCSYLNFRFCNILEQGVLWHSNNCNRVPFRTGILFCTDEYSQHSSIILSVSLNGWVFVYELSGYGFDSRCTHLNVRFGECFDQGVPWHSGNYRVWIRSKTRPWPDNNIQSSALYRLVLTRQLYHLASLAKLLSVPLQNKGFWVWNSCNHLNVRFRT